MYSLSILVTVVARADARRFLGFFKEEKVNCLTMTVGRGTASGEMLDYFGMESREKIVIFTIVTHESWRHVKERMEQKLNIDVPGTGISFIIPVSSVGGGKALRYLLAGQEYEKEEESELKNTEYELLIVISNYGYNNLVMEAARGAGAGGGTVVHARGTGMEKAEKFLGVTLAEEKEMTFIVARAEKKNEIMQAIMEKAGMDSKAKSILFSLPVTETAGLRISGDWKG